MVRLFLRPSKSGVLQEHSNETDYSYITFNIYVNLKISKAIYVGIHIMQDTNLQTVDIKFHRRLAVQICSIEP